jgi:hypothetical protein
VLAVLNAPADGPLPFPDNHPAVGAAIRLKAYNMKRQLEAILRPPA